MQIKFGTSGWRAIIAEDFTFENVKIVTNSICSYLKSSGDMTGKPLIIGHDSRFMGEKFGGVAARIAESKGFRVLQCTGPTPTPTISHAIRQLGASGAMNFTASHNPPEYQGIKFSTSNGAPALPDVTSLIEKGVVEKAEASNSPGGSVEDFDPKPAYFEDIKAKVNFEPIAAARGKFAYDALWGTGRGYLDTILRDHGLEVETIHDWRDVTFGGRSP
jgi:phosphoglucomutase